MTDEHETVAATAVGGGPLEPGRTARKRRAILDAATRLFLQHGYLGANLDEVAAAARVSKQTIYKQFESKEALFLEIVGAMTHAASDGVHEPRPQFAGGDDVAAYLRGYALRQLEIVLTPRLMQLRRMVIGEVGRFPELGRNLYAAGPKRALAAFAETLRDFSERGVLSVEDAEVAASQFNWLVMGAPLNEAMLLGDEAIPDAGRLRRHAEQAVEIFLAAYRPRA
jgi:AcrR family transcriptional regulator